MRVKVTVGVLGAALVATSAGTALAWSANPSATPGTSVTAPRIDMTPTGWSCDSPEDPGSQMWLAVQTGRTGSDSVREVFRDYPVNGRGQTYGPRHVGDAIGYPDLIAARAQGFDGQFADGYVLRCDADFIDSDGRVLPLFASDGETLIGYWRSADNRNPVTQTPTRN